jgi:multicomponent Na+:H+ antiporter subunit F
MNDVLIGVVLVVGLLITVALHRVGRGPTIFDRLVGVALAAANSVVLLLLIGFLFDRPEMFVDIALAYALLAFLFPVALAKYLDRETQERREAAAADREEEGL